MFLNKKDDLQLLDLLHISRREREVKETALQSIQDLREWEKILLLPLHPSISTKALGRTIILRRRAKQAVKTYRDMRKNRMEIFQNYIACLPNRSCYKRLAS